MVNKKGGIIIEAILIMVLFMSLAIYVQREFKSKELASKLITSPWNKFDSMIRNGNWTSDRDESDSLHPSHSNRHTSYAGKTTDGDPIP